MTETTLSHEVTIRPATAADVPEITRIYNEGIRDRLATLETEERTPRERLAWLEARDERHPVLVAERAGAVAGWGSLNVFNPRPAYAHVEIGRASCRERVSISMVAVACNNKV